MTQYKTLFTGTESAFHSMHCQCGMIIPKREDLTLSITKEILEPRLCL